MARGKRKYFVRKLYANIYKCELNCEMTSSSLAKKHHAQKIGHLMLDGKREEKCIQLCLNKSKRCMNKKQKENVFACFFSYNNNAIA